MVIVERSDGFFPIPNKFNKPVIAVSEFDCGTFSVAFRQRFVLNKKSYRAAAPDIVEVQETDRGKEAFSVKNALLMLFIECFAHYGSLP